MMLPHAAARPSDSALANLALQIEEAKVAFSDRFERNVWGPGLFAPYSATLDGVLTDLFRRVGSERPKGIVVVAVGGYGRGDLCPYSDLDFWLVAKSRREKVAQADPVLEKVLYALWDLKRTVGHAVRTFDELFDLAAEDFTAATALLDMRFLFGDEDLYARLQQRTRKFFLQHHVSFVHQLRSEQADRRKRFGDTVFLLEPNLKNGEGGYRDLLLGLWAARARFGGDNLAELIANGALGNRNAQVLRQALYFFQWLRVGAQLHSKRKNDRFTFEIQEALAPRLYREGRPVWQDQKADRAPVATQAVSARPAVAPAVEALMQHYFVCAKQVQRETEALLHRAERSRRTGITAVALDSLFGVDDGRLVIVDENRLKHQPEGLMGLFSWAQKRRLMIAPETVDWIADFVAHDTNGRTLFENRQAQELLRDVILQDDDQTVPSAVEQMHDAGLLNLLMPEFAPCTARVQHDLYHVYTVDQHLLYALIRLKAVARGEFLEKWPLATKVMAETQGRRSLYLGTMLHDVGKPLGKGHSESGAKLAREIALRFAFSSTEVEHTEFLVRHHLLLAHLSQRRDIDDPEVAAEVARKVGSLDVLRQLYLLSLVDMAMVAPGNLTEWKAHLLDELFLRVAAIFAPLGEAKTDTDQRDRRLSQVADLVEQELDVVRRWASSLPPRYFRVNSVRRIARHFSTSIGRRGHLAMEVTPRLRKQVTELTVCIDDFPGALAKITGVLLAHRMNVLHAEVICRQTGHGTEVLDVFALRDRYGQPIVDRQKWAKFEQDLAAVLAQQRDVDVLIANHSEVTRLPDRVMPIVETEVLVSNDVSPEFTVIDVFTLDRVGVLYQITRTLSDLGLNIALSKIATEASRVIDVFYVQDLQGGKLVSEALPAVVSQLTAALEKVPA